MTRAELLEEGYPEDASFVVQVGEYPELLGAMELLFVGADGSSTSVRLPRGGVGAVGSSEEALCVQGHDALLRLTGSGGEETPTDTDRGSGVDRSLMLGKARCVGLLNNGFYEGGYRSDVTVAGRGTTTARVIKGSGSPDSLALDDDDLWMLEPVDTEGRVALRRLDLGTKELVDVTVGEGAPDRALTAPTVKVGAAGADSQLFVHDGTLLMFENFGRASGPADGSAIALGSWDMETGEHRAVPLNPPVQSWVTDADGDDSYGAFALADGHFFDGLMWIADFDGRVLGVDPATAKVERSFAFDRDDFADATVGTWREGRVYVLTHAGTKRAAIVGVDLRSGEATEPVPVPGVAKIKPMWDVHGLAALPASDD